VTNAAAVRFLPEDSEVGANVCDAAGGHGLSLIVVDDPELIAVHIRGLETVAGCRIYVTGTIKWCNESGG
jgi:hypothetical protein